MDLGLIIRTLFILCVCNRISPGFDIRDRNEQYVDKNVVEYTICNEKWCEKYSPSYVKTTFPGVLLTKDQYSLHQEKFNHSRYTYLQEEGVKNVNDIMGLQGDGDSCCVTNHETYINTSLINIDGQERAIVHMSGANPPLYQFIPHAFCLISTVADCDGICALEYVTLTFLVYDTVAKTMVFDQFLLPGYCSCKRVLY